MTVRTRKSTVYLLTLAIGILAAVRSGGAVDRVSVNRDGRAIQLAGKILVEAQDGGMLLLSSDGVLWIVQPEEIQSREADEKPFVPLGQAEMARQLLEELPAGFRIHQTANYVICYNTSEAYAEWCGGLYERLNRAFYSFWKNRGLELRKPEFPLVALVFDNKSSYAEYSRPELGEAIQAIIGYYNMRTNRVTMYDSDRCR